MRELARTLGEGANEGAVAEASWLATSVSMKRASPKYVPREWMLLEAYTAATKGDSSVVHRLQEVFRAPYDEQPQIEEMYYRRRPEEANQGGVAFMS